MAKYFLALFGLIGLAISVVQGIEPFIEVTKWVAWITENWTSFWRSVWSIIFSLFRVTIPTELADGLTGLAYVTSIIIATRRMNTESANIGYKIAEKFIVLFEKLATNENIHIRSILGTSSLLLIILPLPILAIFIANYSFFTAIPVFILNLLFLYLFFRKSTQMDPAGELLFGKGKGQVSGRAGDLFFLMSISVPVAVLGMALAILLINEIAANGENILNAYEWARCDAGIECKE